jgi:hypothetical protein
VALAATRPLFRLGEPDSNTLAQRPLVQSAADGPRGSSARESGPTPETARAKES